MTRHICGKNASDKEKENVCTQISDALLLFRKWYTKTNCATLDHLQENFLKKFTVQFEPNEFLSNIKTIRLVENLVIDFSQLDWRSLDSDFLVLTKMAAS